MVAERKEKPMDKILLFIPMYNCEKQIPRVLAQLDREVCDYLCEVIVVNNRSTDNGEQAVRDYLEANPPAVTVRLLRNDANYGLGGSHKVAFQYALTHGFDYVMVLHGDDQGNIANILPYLKSGVYRNYDCFLGARFMKGSRLQGYSKFRTFGNIVYNVYFSALSGMAVYDLGSGLNLYRTQMLKDPFYIKFPDNLMFNCYMLLAAKACRVSYRFFPISWAETDQVSNVKMMSQAIRTLKIPLHYLFSSRTGFLQTERREHPVKSYTAEIIYTKEEVAV